MNRLKMIDRLLLFSFMYFFLAFFAIHINIFYRDFALNERNLSYLSIGIGYDLMLAAEFSLIAYLFNFLSRKAYKLALALVGCGLLIFNFGDYLYYLNFSTHVPFSNVEYTENSSVFMPSLINALSSKYMLILVASCALFLFGIYKIKDQNISFLNTGRNFYF